MLTIETKAFERALSIVSRAIQRSTIPALGCVRLRADEDGAQLITTNLAIEVAADLADASVKKPIDVCIPLDRLQSALKVAGQDISVKAEKGKANIKTGRSNLNPAVLPGADMPIMEIENERVATFSCEWLAEAISRVIYAAGVQDVRAFLNTVAIESDGKKLAVVATTGLILAAIVRDYEGPEFSIAVPRDNAAQIAKLGRAEYVVMKDALVARTDDVSLAVKLYIGRYPDWRRTIPKELSSSVTVPIAELSAAVSVAGNLDEKSINKVIRMTGDGGAVVVSDIGTSEFEATIDTTGAEGEQISTGFSAPQLISTIKQLTGDDIRLSWGDQRSAFVIADGDFTALIMPMRI